jgi:glycosyltransferase involved in cell wall biosynthesis
MLTIVSYPGSSVFAQQVARAFLEQKALQAYATTFVFHSDGVLDRALRWVPVSIAGELPRNLGRRSLPIVPSSFVRARPFWEIVRTGASWAGANPAFVDRIWDQMSHDFDRWVGGVSQAEAVYAYEYTALATFEHARAQGVARVLDLPSLNSRDFEALQHAEKEKFAELRSRHDAYFDNKFDRRQARRDAEIELAEVIVANSTLTKRSHIARGADAAKIVVVPYGAPPAAMSVRMPFDPHRPLHVVWAGSFSIRKGAHHFLEAWRSLHAGPLARASVCGGMGLPESALRPIPAGVSFRGSIVQAELFATFDCSDILVFPTLSDGFGMVVTEAFAHGLPVITTDQAGAADLVRHGENGLIVPAGDAAALKDALQWCLDNRRAIYEMRFAALETAKRWQWSDYRRKLIEEVGAGLLRAGYTPTFNQMRQEGSSA